MRDSVLSACPGLPFLNRINLESLCHSGGSEEGHRKATGLPLEAAQYHSR